VGNKSEQYYTLLDNSERLNLDDECPHCGNTTYAIKRGPHVGWYCDQCGWLKWIPQRRDPSELVFPIGKHKGARIADVWPINPDYIRWFADKDGTTGRRCREFLEAHNA